jgi:hypothetical protein
MTSLRFDDLYELDNPDGAEFSSWLDEVHTSGLRRMSKFTRCSSTTGLG